MRTICVFLLTPSLRQGIKKNLICSYGHFRNFLTPPPNPRPYGKTDTDTDKNLVCFFDNFLYAYRTFCILKKKNLFSCGQSTTPPPPFTDISATNRRAFLHLPLVLINLCFSQTSHKTTICSIFSIFIELLLNIYKNNV